jgi:transposase InsO family protein
MVCPDPVQFPTAYHIWSNTDQSLRSFILARIDRDEYDAVSGLDTAHAVFAALWTRHEKLGLHAQINLIRKAFDMQFDPNASMDETLRVAQDIHDRIVKMGPLDSDKLLSIILINCLARHFPQLQSEIQGMTNNPTYTSADAVRRIRTEIDLRKRNTEMGSPAPAVALAATSSNRRDPTVVCSNCKKLYHTINFCIKKGGKMAGRTIEDAQAAQRLATGKPAKPSPTTVTTTANVGTTNPPSALVATSAPPNNNVNANPPPLGSVIIHGVPYALTPLSTAAPATANIATQIISPAGTAGTPGNMTDLVQYTAFISDHNPSRASLDWKEFARDIDDRSLEAWSAESGSIFSAEDCPFLMDTGATCHISPNREDFLKLNTISPHPVHGLGDSCVYAVGMGVLSLPLDTGKSILLQNALFIPASKVRLLSVLSLNRAGDFISHFDSEGCWVTTQDGLCLARGTVIPGRDLYTMFSNPSYINRPSTPQPPPTCLYSSRLPNVETWHRRLGHCGNRAIINMARDGAVKGDLSTTPPRCNNCILGKQARSSVPRVREGEKATARLGRVYVDLTGPMSIKTKAGNWYLMNIIDDFSSYVWSIPLASKSDATQALQTWHRAIVNQSDARLKIINTDNGELLSNATTDWCVAHGIVHHLTAPHTSAHNGRVERLHRTIMGKARAMRLACNAPSELWDEFCATAAYLTNFTTSSSNDGKTPHELWFSSKPSLTHLREIGCKAFALILSPNPKIYQRSVPCILIGYAPHSKAYRLWNPASGRIFNSFHVTFVEHLNELPASLLPGTIVPFDADNSDPTWDTVGIPPNPALHIPAHTYAPPPAPTSYTPITTAIQHPLPLPAPLPAPPPALLPTPAPRPPPLPLPPPTATLRNQQSASGPPIGSAQQQSASGPATGSAPQHLVMPRLRLRATSEP